MAESDAKLRISAENRTKQAFAEIERSMRSVEGASNRLRGALGTIGAGLSVAGLAAFVKSGINAADELGKLSQKVGVSVESLSAFQYAAKLADVSSEELATGLRQLAKNAQDAQANTGDAKDAFIALGIAVSNSSGQLKTTEELLLTVAEKFAGIEDGAGKTALAMKIFGRAGAQLIPLLNNGRAGFEELRLEAERLGIIISTKTAAAAERFNDDLTRLGTAADKLKFALAENALPALNNITTAMRLAAQEGGALHAIFIGLGGVASEIFTASDQRRLEEVQKRLVNLRQEWENIRNAPPGFRSGTEKRLDRVQRDITEAMAQEEQILAQISARARVDKPASSAGKSAAPALPTTGTDKRFQTAIEQLTQESQKIQELTRFEEVLADAQRGRYGSLTTAEQDRLTALAAEIDLHREDLRVQKEADAAAKKFADEQVERTKREAAEVEALTRKYKDMADPLAPLIRQRMEIQKLGKDGDLSSAEATAALFAIEEKIEAMQGLKLAIKDTDDTARELGLTMTSALGRIITEGGKASDVMRALLQDIAQIIIKKTILKPFEDGIGSIFEGLFKAEGGPVSGGRPYIVGEQGPELFVPGSSGSIVPNHALVATSAGSPTTVNINFSANTPAAVRDAVFALAPQLTRQAVAAVRDDRNRSGDRR